MEVMKNRYNLVDEAWIPVAGEGLVSLKRIFSDPRLKALGGNPVQKIAVTKLLQAIAQAAATPKDESEWQAMGTEGLASKVQRYLSEKRDCFWLYGERPFLQMRAIAGMEKFLFGNLRRLQRSALTTSWDNAPTVTM